MTLAVHHSPLNAYTGSQLKLQCVICLYCNALYCCLRTASKLAKISATVVSCNLLHRQSTLVTDTNHVPRDMINGDRKGRYHTRHSDGSASGAAIHTASGVRLSATSYKGHAHLDTYIAGVCACVVGV